MRENVLFPQLAEWDPAPLRSSLRRGGYHREALEALGMPERWLRSEIPRAAMIGKLPPNSPVGTLVRLFTLGEVVDGAQALRALGDAGHGLMELGFFETGGGRLRSLYQLSPTADGWYACDFRSHRHPTGPDHVMGVGPSSMLLASLTPHLSKGRALELACGIGWLSGHLARAGMPVVATDLNARALDLGEFTARLSGADGIDFRHGDGFAAVSGERFDLIVSNPPYVQSPGGPMIYREAPAGDPVCARFLRAAPDHLTDGGLAVILLNWSHASDDDWRDGPLSWAPAAGTRRWLFQTDCSSTADYAWKWISVEPAFSDEDAAVAEMERWLAHYRATGVERISGGFMVIQKCAAGAEWTRSESRSCDNIDPMAGVEIVRVLENETWLAGNPALLDHRYRVPDAIRAEAGMVLGNHGWERETIRLVSPARLAYDGQIDENILRLLAIVGEGRTPAALVAEIRSRPEFAAIPDLPEKITDLVRELVRHGMLIPG